jgi:hypothetical protein
LNRYVRRAVAHHLIAQSAIAPVTPPSLMMLGFQTAPPNARGCNSARQAA